MSEAKFFEAYSRWDEPMGRYEEWGDSVSRVMEMHLGKYEDKMSDELLGFIEQAGRLYEGKRVLGAQRALQFGGEQLLNHQVKMYNCVSSWADRATFFQECMYMLLCGSGAGFSVQWHHVEKIPTVLRPDGEATVTHVVEDSIEGWAYAFGALLGSYMTDGASWPEYRGKTVHFDLNQIRPKGAEISGGFKAPGPEPLRKALDLVERLLWNATVEGEHKLKPIEVYDITMFMADAVISGGVRRSATICLFSHDDYEMATSKTFANFNPNAGINPQRGRSNNSAVIVRDEITRMEFANIMKQVRDFGEPGFIFTDNRDFTYNPCVEIGKYPMAPDGSSGWQGCNLTEINGAECYTADRFYEACQAAATIGTLQAGYTDFKLLPESTKAIFEAESLIGVSVTGWMNNPEVLFNEEVMRKGAQIVKETNRRVAQLIGINPAARTTCVKPSGNASVLLQTASGIHGEHSPRYLRAVQLNKETEVAQLLAKTNPEMVEESIWSANNTDYCVYFPVESPEGSVYKSDLLGVKQLEYVKLAQEVWVEEGTNVDLCVDPNLRHNVSNTITVDDWDEVEQYVYDNRYSFAGISFLPASGDTAYDQAPFGEVKTEEDIVVEYGPAALFASGLIVDGLEDFNDSLWEACSAARFPPDSFKRESRRNLLQRDWVRRFNNFADRYFSGDKEVTDRCLKDVWRLHKWTKIINNYTPIDWTSQLSKKEFVDIDTLGAVACSGGACEVTF